MEDPRINGSASGFIHFYANPAFNVIRHTPVRDPGPEERLFRSLSDCLVVRAFRHETSPVYTHAQSGTESVEMSLGSSQS